jgi:hypothetical protein
MTNPAARQSFYQAALDAFWKGRALVPRDENFALEIGFTFDVLNRYPEAEWMYSEALALDPKSKAMRGWYNAHLGRWRNASKQPPGSVE